jgi:hypothetical protein
VNWAGSKHLTISAQPDGIDGSITMCRAGTTVNFYALLLCTSRATVKVTVIGYTAFSGIKLRTDGSLVADVFVRDQPANIGSLATIGVNQTMAVTLSSVLKVNGNLAGSFSRLSSD